MSNPYHRLGNAQPSRVGRLVAEVMDRIQHNLPGEQAQAIGVVYLTLCGQLGIHPREALQYSERMVALEMREVPEFRACAAYLADEVVERAHQHPTNTSAHYESLKNP